MDRKPRWQFSARISLITKKRLEQYAMRHQISQNAAVEDLIVQALDMHSRDLNQWQREQDSLN